MTYRCYHRWFTDIGMHVSVAKEDGLYSIAAFIVRYGGYSACLGTDGGG